MKFAQPSDFRRQIALAIGAALLVGVTSLTTAAQAATPTLSAVEIVNRNVTARGGLAAWRAVNALSMSGMVDAGRVSQDTHKLVEESRSAPTRAHKRLHPEAKPGAPAAQDVAIREPFVMDMKRPHKMRFELKVKDQTAVQVFDGEHGWKLRPYLGRHEVEAFKPEELKLAQEQPELDGPLVDYAAKGTKIEAMGTEQVDGREAYKLKLTLKDGTVMRVWVDAQTFLDVRLGTTRKVGGKPRGVSTYLRDFRKVNGVMLPFQLETRLDGVAKGDLMDIQQVSVNPTLADSRFAKPE